MNRFYYLNPVCPESISNKRVHASQNIEIRIFEVLLKIHLKLPNELMFPTKLQPYLTNDWENKLKINLIFKMGLSMHVRLFEARPVCNDASQSRTGLINTRCVLLKK